MDHSSREPSHQDLSEPYKSDGSLPFKPATPVSSARVDLVLFSGILSLFMCLPLGIVAWVLANADLKKIREGKIPADRIGALRAGKVLGIMGTIVCGTVLILGLVAIWQGVEVARWGVKNLGRSMTPEPLPAHLIMYAGEWRGNKGTLLRIRLDGSGDFMSRHSTVTGGTVRISETTISIGMLGFSKTWHIDRAPDLRNGTWSMELDGEIFTKREEGLMVKRDLQGSSGVMPAAVGDRGIATAC
ncbi:MAG: hypothetical protein FJY85_00980 [Deltaproteobacteria bacterium]|nr:hypothetical protein [Deltaproteobacteria bacterium]